MKLLIIICIFTTFNYCFAGGHVVGNGGYVVKCVHNNIESYKSYDLVEGLILENINPDFSSQEGYINKAKEILSRIKIINPTRYSMYMSWLNDFPRESKIVTGVELIDIPDISIGVRPKDCLLIQAIVQNSNVNKADSRYLINGDVWMKLNEDHKSALVLHELIYREAINELNKHENSYYVRKFNQLLFSSQMKKLHLKDYILFLKSNYFSQADAHGVSIMLYNVQPRTKLIYEYPVEFWNENSVKSAHIYLNGKFNSHGIKAEYVCLNRNWQIYHDDFQVVFYQNNKVMSIQIPSVDDVNLDESKTSCSGGRIDLSAFGFNGNMVATKFEFNTEGFLTSASADYYVQGNILRLNGEKNLSIQILSSQPEVDLIKFVPFKEISLSNEVCVNQRDWLMYQDNIRLERNVSVVMKNSLSGNVNYILCPPRKY